MNDDKNKIIELPAKKLTPEEKLFLSLKLYWHARELKAAALRTFYPELTETEIQEKVYKIFLYART